MKAFECLGACDIAPMASVDGEYVGPLVADGLRRRSSTTSRPAARCCPDKQLKRRKIAAEHWQERLMELLYKDLDDPALATLDGY